MLLRIILHTMVLWRCYVAYIILYVLWLINSVPSYHRSPLYSYLTFFLCIIFTCFHSITFLLSFYIKSFWLSYSISQCNFQFSHYFYPYSPSLLPLSVSTWHVSLSSTLPLYQFLRQQYVVLVTSTNLISPSLAFCLTPSFCPSLSLSLSKSVISFFYFDNFYSLSLLLYPGNFFALNQVLFLSLSVYLLLLPSLCYCIFLILSLSVSLSL